MYSGADTGKHSQSGFMYLMGMQEGMNETMQVWRPGEQYQATGLIALHFGFFSFKTRSPSELAVIDSIGFAAGESQRCSCFSF